MTLSSSRRGVLRVAAAAMAAAVFMISVTGSAFAAGTGDDPRPIPDVLTRGEAAKKARLEAEHGDGTPGGVQSLVFDAPYRYLYTPSHLQGTDYYCGPATVQVIHDYFGWPFSQPFYAQKLGTTTAGTNFSRVDDILRAYVRPAYYYYGDLTESAFNYRVQHSILTHGYPLAADLNVNGLVWDNYVFSHNGHIMPIEGFDWRYMVIRVNDVYDEARYRAGGGQTFGHKVYPQSTVWHGVSTHFRKAVVGAP